jgi:hypothetical protein
VFENLIYDACYNSGSLRSFCVFYEVFIAENVCGVGDKGSGDIMVYLQILLGVFLSMTVRFVCFFHETFFQNKAKLLASGLLSHVPGYHYFEIMGCQIKGILRYLKFWNCKMKQPNKYFIVGLCK